MITDKIKSKYNELYILLGEKINSSVLGPTTKSEINGFLKNIKSTLDSYVNGLNENASQITLMNDKMISQYGGAGNKLENYIRQCINDDISYKLKKNDVFINDNESIRILQANMNKFGDKLYSLVIEQLYKRDDNSKKMVDVIKGNEMIRNELNDKFRDFVNKTHNFNIVIRKYLLEYSENIKYGRIINEHDVIKKDKYLMKLIYSFFPNVINVKDVEIKEKKDEIKEKEDEINKKEDEIKKKDDDIANEYKKLYEDDIIHKYEIAELNNNIFDGNKYTTTYDKNISNVTKDVTKKIIEFFNKNRINILEQYKNKNYVSLIGDSTINLYIMYAHILYSTILNNIKNIFDDIINYKTTKKIINDKYTYYIDVYLYLISVIFIKLLDGYTIDKYMDMIIKLIENYTIIYPNDNNFKFDDYDKLTEYLDILKLTSNKFIKLKDFDIQEYLIYKEIVSNIGKNEIENIKKSILNINNVKIKNMMTQQAQPQQNLNQQQVQKVKQQPQQPVQPQPQQEVKAQQPLQEVKVQQPLQEVKVQEVKVQQEKINQIGGYNKIKIENIIDIFKNDKGIIEVKYENQYNYVKNYITLIIQNIKNNKDKYTKLFIMKLIEKYITGETNYFIEKYKHKLMKKLNDDLIINMIEYTNITKTNTINKEEFFNNNDVCEITDKLYKIAYKDLIHFFRIKMNEKYKISFVKDNINNDLIFKTIFKDSKL